MKRLDLLLKIIAAADGDKVTPAQLQKVAFLVGMEFPQEVPNDYYVFEKYDYGPFSLKVYKDAEKLEEEGLVSIDINRTGGWKEYSATRHGRESNLDMIPQRISDFIENKMAWARQLSFQQLIRAIYREYPQYRENSVFQNI